MTNDQIDRLIARRARLTSRRDGLYSHAALARIDARLRAAVPFGARPDVDKLLGRSHPDFGPQPAPQDYRIANRTDNPNWNGVAEWFDKAAGLTPRAVADMEARCAETATPEEYSSATEGHW